MEHIMRKLTLAVALVLPFAQTPAFAEGVTVIGPNGGTVDYQRSCERGGGAANCSTTSTYTSPLGETATKSRVRSTVPGSSTTEVTRTGPDGNTRTRVRSLTWGN
jgi:hypothetical protein